MLAQLLNSSAGTRWRRAVLVGGAVAGAAGLADPRIDPAEWHPLDPPAMTGPLERSHELVGAETVVTCEGPEDVAFDDKGRLYTGTEDNSIARTVDPVDADTTDAVLEPFARLDGRPLGMTFEGDDLLVCATDAGLQSVAPDGGVFGVTSATPREGALYLGSLFGRYDT